MARKILVAEDHVGNTIADPAIDPRTSDPSSPVAGQIWYRSDLNAFRASDGTNVFTLPGLGFLLQTGTSYTIKNTDTLVVSSGATGNVTFTLPSVATCRGPITVVNDNDPSTGATGSYSVTINRAGTDSILADSGGINTSWLLDGGVGSATTFWPLAGHGAWFVTSSYATDVYWSWMNLTIADVADTNYTMTGQEYGIRYTSITAGRQINLPSVTAVPDKLFVRIFDGSGNASSVNTITLVPHGTDLINGSNSNYSAIGTAYGWVELQGDASTGWVVSGPSTTSLTVGLGVHNAVDVDVTVAATDDIIIFTSSTTSHVVTLPAATRTRVVAIIDASGQVTNSNPIYVKRAGSDTINGGTANVAVINTPYGGATLASDQVSNWTTSGSQVDTLNAQTIYGAKTFNGLLAIAGGLTENPTAVSDAAYNALATDVAIKYTTLTATRAVTLLAAVAGTAIALYDASGSASTTIKLQFTPHGTDTINGVNATTDAVNGPYGGAFLWSPATGKWILVANCMDLITAQTIAGNKTFTGTTALAGFTTSAQCTNYGGVATVAAGLESILAKIDLTTQGAAVGPTTMYTTPNSASPNGEGLYEISWCAIVTRAASGGSPSSTLGGSGGFQVTYTDTDTGNATTPTHVPNATATGNTTTTQLSGVVVVNAKRNTNIQYNFGYTSSGSTSMQYALHIKVKYLG